METKTKKAHPKKVLRASLSEKLKPVLTDIKTGFTVNEKKFEKLVKKAVKLLADGLHGGHTKTPKAKPAKKTAPKKKAVIPAKSKAPVKKNITVKPTAKKAAPKKATPKKAAKKK